MVTQFKMVPDPPPICHEQPSLLFNKSLVAALRDLIGQVIRFTDTARPRILCLGNDSQLIPNLVGDRASTALNCQFIHPASTSSMVDYDLSGGDSILVAQLANEADSFDAVVLLVDEHLTLTQTLLHQIKLHLATQGRLIVVAPYQASVVTVLQRSLRLNVPKRCLQESAAATVSVNELFHRLKDEGFGDPYLRLVGGLPGFWESAVCSVTPQLK